MKPSETSFIDSKLGHEHGWFNPWVGLGPKFINLDGLGWLGQTMICGWVASNCMPKSETRMGWVGSGYE